MTGPPPKYPHLKLPDGCMCGPSWGQFKEQIPPICNGYIRGGFACWCCHHDEKCHAAKDKS